MPGFFFTGYTEKNTNNIWLFSPLDLAISGGIVYVKSDYFNFDKVGI
jgi:TM2 domain-containing membrane protein YozV